MYTGILEKFFYRLSSLFSRGVHPLWGNDAFPPYFRFLPYFREIFQTPWKFDNFTFSQNNFDFHPPKFL